MPTSNQNSLTREGSQSNSLAPNGGALVERAPQEVRAWVVLSYALLQEGADSAAAERALLKVLELDPGNAEARHNLGVLRAQNRGA
jgi:Flp pilus assembly protein TadD